MPAEPELDALPALYEPEYDLDELPSDAIELGVFPISRLRSKERSEFGQSTLGHQSQTKRSWLKMDPLLQRKEFLTGMACEAQTW